MRSAPIMTEEHEADHAVRVKIWVTFVTLFAFTGSMFLPDASGWLGFFSSLFWIWRN
jgi:hypothetical protein